MIIADSRVVAYRWPNERGHFNFLHGNIRPYPDAEPLVPLSLLAEAEREVARLTSCLSQANILIEQFERDWYMACDERDRNAAQNDALQSRLDAVAGLADRMRNEGGNTLYWSEQLRAALGCATTGEMK